MNTTDWNNHSTFSYDERFTNTLAIIQGSIYIPIFCAGIANNFLTILIILLNRDMRTVTNCYLLNLAISDTLPLIVSLPFEISFLPVEVPWGHLGCKLRALLAETSTNASILTISAFTIERYLAVCRPVRHLSLSTTQRAIRAQIFIWFIAILSSTPYFYFTKSIERHCNFDQNSQLYVTICFHISAACFFVIPAVILCVLYALMAQRLYNVSLLHQVSWSKNGGINARALPINLRSSGLYGPRLEQQLRAARHVSSPTILLTQQSTFQNRNIASPALALHIQSMKKSAFKMLFAVVIAFIICYAPFHVQRLITSRLNVSHLSLIEQRSITIFYFISGIFYYIGSTVNPIFYHLFSRKYRLACIRTMKRLVHCKRRDYKRNVQRQDKSRLITKYQNPPQVTKKTTETIYRSPNRIKSTVDIGHNQIYLSRISLPAFNHERIR